MCIIGKITFVLWCQKVPISGLSALSSFFSFICNTIIAIPFTKRMKTHATTINGTILPVYVNDSSRHVSLC